MEILSRISCIVILERGLGAIGVGGPLPVQVLYCAIKAAFVLFRQKAKD